MVIPEIVSWAKKVKSQSKEFRANNYESRRLPKIDAYLDMIVARGTVIQEQTVKMQRYTEEIQDALKKLSDYGVSVPTEPKPITKSQENPLRP